MNLPNPYAPPLTPISHPGGDSGPRRALKAIIEGAAAGLALALLDVNNLTEQSELLLLLLVAGVALGARHGAAAGVLAWLPLGGLLYVVHLIAIIGLGYKQPFVERDAETAAMCLVALMPAGLGVACGVMLRSAWGFVQQEAAAAASARRDN